MKKSLALTLSILIFVSIVVVVQVSNVLSQLQKSNVQTFNVQVVITKNFGRSLMLEEYVQIETGTTAMDTLKKVAEVETRYGGGFVYSINNVSSQYTGTNPTKKDWFFYVNGMLANVGATDYQMCEGDIEHWDFHDWSFYPTVSAIIGDFPEPFLHGYGGKTMKTIIVYQEGFKEEASLIKNSLTSFGVKHVLTKTLTNLKEEEKKHSNLILIGTQNFQPIQELNKIHEKLGFYVYFDDGKMVLLDCKGNVVKKSTSGGVIQATQNPWNPKGTLTCENVVWVISGITKNDVKNTVMLFINNPEEFSRFFAVVIVEGKVYGVPPC